jgi:hypothetical protein
MDHQSVAPIAAVLPNGCADIDQIVSGFAIAQIGRGRQIRGLVQETCGTCQSKQVSLVDLDSGRMYPITQYLGTHSVSCRLDLGGIVESSVVMRRIALRGADLAIFNRYSALEAKGGGFAAEMLDLMSRHIPVLTIVPRRHLDAWRKFTGGFAAELEPTRSALEQWFEQVHPHQPPDIAPSSATAEPLRRHDWFARAGHGESNLSAGRP